MPPCSATIAVGETYPLQLAPPWSPQAAGDYVVIGPVNESGEWIGTVQQPIGVVEAPVPCPIPTGPLRRRPVSIRRTRVSGVGVSPPSRPAPALE